MSILYILGAVLILIAILLFAFRKYVGDSAIRYSIFTLILGIIFIWIGYEFNKATNAVSKAASDLWNAMQPKKS